MKLYMIRHGQSVNNVTKCYSGWQQVELSPQGREEAAEIGKQLQNINFDRVYSSDLIRALETQKIALPEVEAIQTPLLREINVGDLAGRKIEQCREQYPYVFQSPDGYASVGGESRQMFYDRVGEFLHLLEKEPADYVAAFCHLGAVRGVMRIIKVDEELVSAPIKNCGIYIFSYEDGKWSLQV